MVGHTMPILQSRYLREHKWGNNLCNLSVWPIQLYAKGDLLLAMRRGNICHRVRGGHLHRMPTRLVCRKVIEYFVSFLQYWHLFHGNPPSSLPELHKRNLQLGRGRRVVDSHSLPKMLRWHIQPQFWQDILREVRYRNLQYFFRQLYMLYL